VRDFVNSAPLVVTKCDNHARRRRPPPFAFKDTTASSSKAARDGWGALSIAIQRPILVMAAFQLIAWRY
jgi:hypothetical protein